MKQLQLFSTIALLLTVFTLSGCQVIGDIFKAGVWSGVLLVVAIVGGVIFLIAKATGK